MAVLINYLEMPKRCEDCPMSCAVEVGDVDAFGCKVFVRLREVWCNTRPSWCPLVEVPEPNRVMSKEAMEAEVSE